MCSKPFRGGISPEERCVMAKYREINLGDIFTIFGVQFIFDKIDGDSIVLKDRHFGNRYIYGLEAFRRIAKQNGYEVKDGKKDG